MGQQCTGIIWVGPIFERGGYGNVSRNCLLALKQIGFPVRAVNYGQKHKGIPHTVIEEITSLRKADVGVYPVGIIHRPPNAYANVTLQGVVKKIGYTIFETDRMPDYWLPYCHLMDEIWVPSQFNRQTFSASGLDPEKIRVVPYGIDTDFFHPDKAIPYPLDTNHNFVFLYVFAFNWRKGFDLLLDAYFQEFSAEDDVSLVLKVYADQGVKQADLRNAILDSVTSRVPRKGHGFPHLLILDEPLSQVELRQLYGACDLYVSTDRANGWSMPCMEAMSLGKPAASIETGGCVEFMNASNSLLIQPTGHLVPVDPRLAEGQPILYGGHRWAEVRVRDVRNTLRFAYEHRETLQSLARQGTIDVRARFSLQQAAEQIIAKAAAFDDIPASRFKQIGRPKAHVHCRLRRAIRKGMGIRSYLQSTEDLRDQLPLP